MAKRVVLLVEDDTDIQSLVEVLLSTEGYSVRLADSAQQALDSIRQEKPGLMLVDLTLPGTSGSELTAVVRHEFGQGIPIIILSAGRDLDKITRQIGANGFLAKPFEVDDLIKIVKKWIG